MLFDWFARHNINDLIPTTDDSPPVRQAFCQLSQAEMEEIQQTKQLVEHYAGLLYRLEESRKTFWWRMMKTYGFGENIEYAPTTGSIYYTPETNNWTTQSQ